MEKNDLYKSPCLSYFSLNRLKAQCHYPPVTVDFANPIPKSCSATVFPVFNQDLCHFTPAFTLPSQKTPSPASLSFEEEKFADKMRTEEEQQESSGLLDEEIRLRASEVNYCQVCKERYEDYWKHMESHLHKRKIAKSEFNQDIAQLCRAFTSGSVQASGSQQTSQSSSRKKRKLDVQQQTCDSQLAHSQRRIPKQKIRPA